MSDLTLGKVKLLYEDMVEMEQNILAVERRINGNLITLDRRTAHSDHQVAQLQRNQNTTTSLIKTIIMVASLAFGVGLSLSTGSNITSVVAGIPIGMALVWGIYSYLDQTDKINTTPPTSIAPAYTGETGWTEDEIRQVFWKIKPAVQDRAQAACLDVLLHGEMVGNAAAKQKLAKSLVESAIGQMYINRGKAKKNE